MYAKSHLAAVVSLLGNDAVPDKLMDHVLEIAGDKTVTELQESPDEDASLRVASAKNASASSSSSLLSSPQAQMMMQTPAANSGKPASRSSK